MHSDFGHILGPFSDWQFLVFYQRTDRTLEAAHLLATVRHDKASKKAANTLEVSGFQREIKNIPFNNYFAYV